MLVQPLKHQELGLRVLKQVQQILLQQNILSYSQGYSNAAGNVMVEAGTSTCVFVNSTKDPTLNIDQTNGGQARRHSLDNGPDKWYNIFFTYEASS